MDVKRLGAPLTQAFATLRSTMGMIKFKSNVDTKTTSKDLINEPQY